MRELFISGLLGFCIINGIYAQVDSLDFSDWEILFDEVVLSAQFEPTSHKNSIHKVHTISKEHLEKFAFTDLEQALQLHGQIRIQKDPLLGTSIKLRGISSNNVAILKDGVPVIGRINGSIDLSQITLDNIERIEIIEGPQSVLYGSSAAGGIINLISSSQNDHLLEIGASSLLESIGINRNQIQLEWSNPKWHFSASAFHLQDQSNPVDSLRIYESIDLSDGATFERKKYPWNPKKQKGVDLGAVFRINDRQSIHIKSSLNDARVSSYGIKKRLNFKPYSFDDVYKTLRKEYSLIHKFEKNKTQIHTSLAYNFFDREITKKRFEFDEANYLDEAISIDSSLFKLYFAKVIFSRPLFSNIKSMSGLNAQQELGFGERILDINTDETTATNTEVSAYADLRWVKKDLSLSLAARETWHSIFGLQFSPSVHMKYDFKSKWTSRMSFARGYRSPDLKERFINFIDVNHYIVGNPQITPELSNDYSLEIGFDQMKQVENFKGTFKAYYNQITDRIVLTEYETLKYHYQNIASSTVYGMSLANSYSLEKLNFETDLNVGFWEDEIHNTDLSFQAKPVLDFNGRIYANYFGLTSSLFYSYVGSTRSFYEELGVTKLREIQPYHLIDFSIAKRIFNESLNLQIGIKNVLNVSYTGINNSSPNSSHSNQLGSEQLVGRGRSFYIQARYQWRKKKF